MYRAKEIAVLVGDLATIPVFEIESILHGSTCYQIRHEEFADVENPTGVRILTDRAYALTLAASLAQDGRIG